jgi:hypothetical protein
LQTTLKAHYLLNKSIIVVPVPAPHPFGHVTTLSMILLKVDATGSAVLELECDASIGATG